MNETDSSSRTVVAGNGDRATAAGTAATPTTMSDTATQPGAAGNGDPSTAAGTAATPTTIPDTATQPQPAAMRRQRMRLMRIPGFAPTAPIGGLFAAWGAAAVAFYALAEAGVALGLGLGLAEGSGAVNDVWPGLWMLVVQFGAFLIGGYVAARMARNRAIAHAVLVWVLAIAATAAEAISQNMRAGGASVLDRIGVAHWTDSGLQNDWRLWAVLAAFAIAALVGTLMGGVLGAAANRAAVIEVETAPRTRHRDGLGAPPA
jgi:hypothetical protein